jgi:multiple sugar transport system substrate-binding protein
MSINRRTFLASGAALAAVAAGTRMGFAQSDVSATLKLGDFGDDTQLTAIKHAVARFNQKYPNVKVDISIDPISTGWGDYVTKVLGQFTAGTAADVYGTATETFKTFAERGLWMPLDDYIAANPTFEDIAPNLFKQAEYKGQNFYIPIGWNNIMINYNRDLFAKAGVDGPTDWTWDEFREVAKKLTVKDASGNVSQWGYEVPNQNFFVQPWFFTNGTSILNEDWTASNMTDPKVAESLQFLHDLIHVDGVSPIPGNQTMDNQFMAGQVAMISRGHWIVGPAKQNKLNMDIADVPSKVNGDTVIGYGAYAINKNSQQADLAKALILELTSKETQIEEAQGSGGMPSRKSATEQPAILAFPPHANLYYPTLANARSVPSPGNFQEVEKIFIRYYQAMMADQMSIADGCKQADAELNASFARLKQALGQG